MARGRKQEDKSADEKKRNWNPADVEKAIEELEEFQDQIKALNEANASRVAAIKGHMGDAYKRYKKLGIDKKPLKTQLKLRAIERQKEEIVNDLEDDEQETLFEYQRALGEYADTPLGQAAMARQEERRQQRDAAFDGIGTEGLEQGIRPLA